MDIPFALSVIFTGVVIVFIVLVILIIVMVLLGKLAGEKTPPSPIKPTQTEARKAPSPAPAVKVSPKMAVEDGIGGETVAVIAAAVASLTGGAGKVTAVRKTIELKTGRASPAGRGAWSMAGLRENTRSF